jgi:hypothetical protein
MDSCQYREYLRYLEFEGVNSLEEYQAIIDGIPHLSYVQQLRIKCDIYRIGSSLYPSNMKANLLRSLARNLSITDVVMELSFEEISFEEEEENIWTELENKALQSLKLRKSACSQIFASPDLIPLGLWPHVLLFVRTTNAITAKSLIFLGLRGLSANLSAP